IPARGRALVEPRNPRVRTQAFALEGRPEILDEVGPDHTARTQLEVARHGPAGRGRVLDGDVLHPLHVSEIADVPIYVYRLRRNEDLFRVDARPGQWSTLQPQGSGIADNMSAPPSSATFFMKWIW